MVLASDSQHLESAACVEHMQTVQHCRVELDALGQQWELLTILGQMSGQNMDMRSTREGFRKLTDKLLQHLSEETLKNVLQQVAAKAQVAVDILIRNLFERTADIGFLATDGDVRLCLQGALEKEILRQHFQEYVAKYSVYDNIILLHPDGKVCVQLDQQNQVEYSNDSLIGKALHTKDAYVEVYRETDLLPGRGKSLLYAYRVTETSAPNSRPIGVLCLCFRFEDETQGIFRKLTGNAHREVILLLDKAGNVLSSSDPFHIPVGVSLQTAFDASPQITWFAGRPYLARTCPTRGYQGFFGLGWLGHVLVPLQQAFAEGAVSINLDASILQAAMQNPRLFSESLRSIPRQAGMIQKALDCTVWNGNARNENMGEAGVRASVLLHEIGKTGRKTQAVFDRAISQLHTTIVSTALNDAAFIAALAIDIMDRNLYERANDCRWWALTREFRERLGEALPLPDSTGKIFADILSYINGLYTVYANLILFDRTGTVVAVSDPSAAEHVGTHLSGDWVSAVLALRDSQQYSVSAFESSDLYAGRLTFIYGAVVRDMSGDVTGGIAIVFDSEPQFQAMLEESMPRDQSGTIVEGAIGLFVDAAGLVIAAYGGVYSPGDRADLPRQLLQPAAGESFACVHQLNGMYYAAGARTGDGYREFKGADDAYQYRVTSIVMIPLGKVSSAMEASGSRSAESAAQLALTDDGRNAEGESFATFYAGGYWLAIPTEAVEEAVLTENITKIPGVGGGLAGALVRTNTSLPVIDLAMQGGESATREEARLVVITKVGAHESIGILADHLGSVVSAESLSDLEALGLSAASFATHILKIGSEEDSFMAVVIDPERLLQPAGCESFAENWHQQMAQLTVSDTPPLHQSC